MRKSICKISLVSRSVLSSLVVNKGPEHGAADVHAADDGDFADDAPRTLSLLSLSPSVCLVRDLSSILVSRHSLLFASSFSCVCSGIRKGARKGWQIDRE